MAESNSTTVKSLLDIEVDLYQLHCVAKLAAASQEIPDPEHGSIDLISRRLDKLCGRLSELQTSMQTPEGAS